MKQYGFYFDSDRCTGCKTCELACKDYKDLSTDVNFRRIYEYTGGNWSQLAGGCWHQDVFAYYMSISCNHCAEPACTKVCPTGAMHKNEDGFVIVNEETCIGCYSRIQEGHKPICVEACPLRALDFAPIDELRAKYGEQASIAPLPPAEITHPNLVVNPNKHARPSGDTSGFLGNPREV